MPALPAGSILLWSGAIVDIPSGYLLCDGSAGTPDLRDRFIMGAGGTYAPGASGGASTHVHTFTGDGHHHDLFPTPALADGGGWSKTTTDVAVTGTTNAGNHLPPYYALAYIFKT